MLSTYQEQQARLRRKPPTQSGLIQERRAEEYKPLRFPASPGASSVSTILAVLHNRRLDDMLEHQMTDQQFKHLLISAGILERDFGESKSDDVIIDNETAINQLVVERFF